ncbi:hypothetical protein [Dyella acidiphila]|uniref:Uncharacterized protein n=1 Tax=Dyella acidiphila TaxID=2775866 RepID=A0ABR9G698_9GAMM|nr:hypothetical protein [Dyella acidiphila]MBE1159560.1 hypothetical protein [Dyella acidiphila]
MKRTLLTACLLAAAMPLAHASSVRAEKLPLPKTMTCLQVNPPIVETITRGLLRIPVEIALGQGAYVSEREDANGVYYRAPEGAITERRTDEKPTSVAGRAATFDGGIYVPNDPAVAPTLYEYYGSFNVVSAADTAAAGNTSCSDLAYRVDPNTHKLNVLAVGLATGLGAATGTATGLAVHHALQSHFHANVGRAAGVGLAGGLIGGLIVAAIENAKVGRIQAGPDLDTPTVEKIKALVANKVAMVDANHPGAANGVASTAAAVPVTPAAVAAAPSVAVAPAAVAVAAAPATAVATQAPADADVQAAVATPSAAPVVAATATDAATLSLAQNVASQMGCGAVQAHGEGDYVAPCGSYGVFIGCDAGQCRPLHTIKLEGDQ